MTLETEVPVAMVADESASELGVEPSPAAPCAHDDLCGDGALLAALLGIHLFAGHARRRPVAPVLRSERDGAPEEKVVEQEPADAARRARKLEFVIRLPSND